MIRKMIQLSVCAAVLAIVGCNMMHGSATTAPSTMPTTMSASGSNSLPTPDAPKAMIAPNY